MYPNVTFHGDINTDNQWFSPDSKVSSLQDTNKSQIMEEYSVSYNAPPNWLHMNDDGTMSAGYKLTPELTEWYEKDGKGILEELYSKIWYKKKERKKSK